MLENKLRNILDNHKGERCVSTFLAKYPAIVLWTVGWIDGHTSYVLKEFQFGNRYRSDFVVVVSYSGA